MKKKCICADLPHSVHEHIDAIQKRKHRALAEVERLENVIKDTVQRLKKALAHDDYDDDED